MRRAEEQGRVSFSGRLGRSRIWFLAVVVIGLSNWGSVCRASDIYLAQTASGDGSSCTSARAVSSLASGDWIAGNTIHLCGTFTYGANAASVITTQGSGSSGKPITVLFESGAVLTADYWNPSTGAININHSYIVIDGGANGIIQNTNNGTSLAYQVDSRGIYAGTGTNVEIRNLTVKNIYQKVGAGSDSYGTSLYAAAAASQNINIHNNTFSNSHYHIYTHFDGRTVDGITIAGNTTSGACIHVLVAGSGNNSVATNISVHDNDISGWSPWFNPANSCHTDGIFLFSDGCSPATSCSATGNIYNNYLHGLLASGTNSSPTGFLTLQTATNMNVFNNIFVWDASSPGGSPVWIEYSTYTSYLYNNTVTAVNGTASDQAFRCRSACTLKNNVVTNFTIGGTGQINSDYNDFNTGSNFACTSDGGGCMSLSSWQTQTGQDLHSTQGNPMLDATYHPQSGSPAIAFGADLTSLGISALDSDKAGVTRPNSGAWTAGVYQSGGTISANAPNPPSGLTAVVN